MAKVVQNLAIEFTQEELDGMGLRENDPVEIQIKDDCIVIKPFETIEIDMAEFNRETLELLVKESCEKNVSVNEIIADILRESIKLSGCCSCSEEGCC